MSTHGVDTVATRIDGGLGVITLNRPKAINALDGDMIAAMHSALDDWADGDAVKAVWVEGAGEKGLCAGGDVRAVREVIRGGDLDRALSFFAHEYELNALIADYPMPFVAWMNGLVMGGGIGISAHGSHRLVTERTTIAMPETIIGFFPDVGALWLLARAPGELGTHLALTGVTVGGAEAVMLGLADHVVSSGTRDEVYADLSRAAAGGDPEALAAWEPPAEHLVEAATSDAGVTAEVGVTALERQRGWIDECYAGVEIETILERLRSCDEPAAANAVELIEQRSPHSVALTLEALRRAAHMSVAEVLAQDLRLARAVIRHPDFDEGVRAQLVDKDKSPQWADRHVSDLQHSDIMAAFDSPRH
ncbi:MAG: enoyl-CoA hydratase/isomerase family protein [Ornithinimicrobium sp.]